MCAVCLNVFNFQTTYSVTPIVKERNYGFFAYSPMSSGWILKDKYCSLAKKRFPYLKPQYYRPEFPLFKEIVQATGKYKINMNQLALSWVLSHQGTYSVICGTSSCEQLLENIKAVDENIASNLIESINNIVQKHAIEKNKVRELTWNIGTKIRKWLS